MLGDSTGRSFGRSSSRLISSPFAPTKHSGNTNPAHARERAAKSIRQMGQGRNNGLAPLNWRTTMLRKITLGLIAAASLGVAALAPGSASAHGFHGGWGHHGGWGYGIGFGPGLYVNTGVNDCYQQRMIQTRHGLRLRTVNVCDYNTY
jgi:hypothetical protein